MLEAYRQPVAERAALGIPPLPLNAQQTADVIELLKSPPAGEEAFLLDLLTHRVPTGVDDAAKVKASFLSAVAHGDVQVAAISKAKATELLGTMVGGYNVKPLIDLLDHADVAPQAATALKKTLLMYDAFHDVADKATAGNKFAGDVIDSWAKAEWFTSRPEVPAKITVTVFKVIGETNTDDLSPAPDAWSRPDIPLHYLAMLKNARPGITPEEDGKRGPMQFIEDLKKKGTLVAYVGDVVEVYPYEGRITKNGADIASIKLKSDDILDSVRAGGSINLNIGRTLTGKAREFLGLDRKSTRLNSSHVD